MDGRTAPILILAPAGVWWKVLWGVLHAPWLCPSSAGQRLGGLGVEVELAQQEVVEEDTEVSGLYKKLIISFFFFNLECFCISVVARFYGEENLFCLF